MTGGRRMASSAPTSPPPGASASRSRGSGLPGAGSTSRVTPHKVQSYSRFVSRTKKLLPIVAALLIALVAFWPYLHKQDNRFRIGFAAIQEQEADSPSMLNPRYLGTDKESQPFSITADIAKNLLQGNPVIELEMPKADITMEDGTWLVLTSEAGKYNQKLKTLDLAGSVNLFHDSGYEFRTTRAYVDLEEGIAVGTEPVEGQGPFGHLTAEGFRLIEKGTTILFTGKSRLQLFPGVAEEKR